MNKQQEKVFNETRIRNLKRRYFQCIDEGEIDDGNNRILMFYRPSIIVRKRLDGTVKAIDKIIKNIEETGFVPAHLLDIVNGGRIERPEEKEESIEELLAKTVEKV